MALKAIIAGGGTGGHGFPAVGVGDEMRRARPDSEVQVVRATNGMDARSFPQHGVRYELFAVTGFAGNSPVARMRALLEFLRSLRVARKLLRNFSPHVVVSAGGYASAPIAVAA